MLCARVDAGELKGSGQASVTGASFNADVAASAGVNLPIASGLRAIVLAELAVPITETTLAFTESGKGGWTNPTLAGFLVAAIGYRF
jgi:hypothetical protein